MTAALRNFTPDTAASAMQLGARYVVEDGAAVTPHSHKHVQLIIPIAAENMRVVHNPDAGSTRTVAHEDGNLYVIGADQPHAFAWQRLEMVSFDIPKRVLDQVADDSLGRSVAVTDWYGLEDSLLMKLGLTMAEHYVDHGKFSRLFAESNGYVAAARLVARFTRRATAPASMNVRDRRVRAACEYVDERLGDELSLETLASVAGLSPYHFLRTFNATVGVTPHRFVLERRLLHARERLVHPTESIGDIAVNLGFGSASHLASAFRRRFGQSPTAFRTAAAS